MWGAAVPNWEAELGGPLQWALMWEAVNWGDRMWEAPSSAATFLRKVAVVQF